MGRLSDEARRQEALVQAALVLGSELSLPVILQTIVDLACDVADARYGALGVVGADGKISEFITHGISQEQRAMIGRLPEGHGLLGVLIDEAKPLRLAHIQGHPKSSGFPANHPPMTSFLGVPIAVRGKVFGNLYLTEKQGAAEFTEGDEDAVIKLAAQAAVAVENAGLFTQTQMGQRRLAAVNDITQAILQGSEVEDVLHLIARNARDLTGAGVASVVTPQRGPNDRQLIVRVAVGDAADELAGMAFPADRSISGEVMQSLKPALLSDAADDLRVHQPFVQAGNIGPAIFVPLATRERRFGTIAVGNARGASEFTQQDLEVIQEFAAQAAVALEHSRIQQELQRLMLVEDRERIAKEIHDDVIQSLFAEGMALQASLSMLGDPAAMELRITQSVEHIDRVIRDLRNYIFALVPGAAADRALERSIREVAASFADGSSAAVEVTVDPAAASKLSARSADLLQVVREAVSNAIRHSGAEAVHVALVSAGDTAVLEISDNGRGFDVAKASARGHGLGNLDARAASLGGELEIESVPDRGTWVRIRIPL